MSILYSILEWLQCSKGNNGPFAGKANTIEDNQSIHTHPKNPGNDTLIVTVSSCVFWYVSLEYLPSKVYLSNFPHNLFISTDISFTEHTHTNLVTHAMNHNSVSYSTDHEEVVVAGKKTSLNFPRWQWSSILVGWNPWDQPEHFQKAATEF